MAEMTLNVAAVVLLGMMDNMFLHVCTTSRQKSF